MFHEEISSHVYKRMSPRVWLYYGDNGEPRFSYVTVLLSRLEVERVRGWYMSWDEAA